MPLLKESTVKPSPLKSGVFVLKLYVVVPVLLWPEPVGDTPSRIIVERAVW